MAHMIRFKMVEIDSSISFRGKNKRTLKHPVRSISLVPETKPPVSHHDLYALPEIFWQ
ncbi:MAG: hypothetical protein WCJ26_05935 [bacterium]